MWLRPLCVGHIYQVEQDPVHALWWHANACTSSGSQSAAAQNWWVPAALPPIHRWPSVPPLSAQSLLDAWRAELARQPLSMSESEACGVLGITPQPNGVVPEEELKAAYRRREWF